MGLDYKGFDDLFSTMNSLGKVGDKIGKDAVKAGLTKGLPTIKRYAPKAPDSGAGARSLKVTDIKKFGADWWGQMGINHKNWEKSKHLFFHNFGYEMKNGKRYEGHVGWLDRAYKAAEKDMQTAMEQKLNTELNKVLK